MWSIGTVIRGASVNSLSVCVCVLCLFLSHAFSNFKMSQSGPLKPAPATCFYIFGISCKTMRLFCLEVGCPRRDQGKCVT